jgi:prohibitin 1
MRDPARSLSSDHRTRRLAPVGLIVTLLSLSACATVRQDEIGVMTRFGRVTSGPLDPGARLIFPGVSSVVKVPARIVNREVRLEMPTREGLNVAAEVSILYRVKPAMLPQILANSGTDYEEDVVIPVFRSAAADVTARFMAKDMHSGTRSGIEDEIRSRMMSVLEPRGFEVENVLLKSIRLPGDLARAIEEKLEAEQRSEQMKFVLDRERQEAERRIIEANGIRDAWAILSMGLTPAIINYQSIEAFRELALSPNTKVIVTDGNASMMLNADTSIEPVPADRTSTTTRTRVGERSTSNAPLSPTDPRRLLRPISPDERP